jgi:hypothetical protein
VILLALLACGRDVPLDGVWLGDLRYDELNGEPYGYETLTVAKFDPDDPREALLYGTPAELKVRRGLVRTHWEYDFSGPDYDYEAVEDIVYDDSYEDGAMAGTTELVQTYTPRTGEPVEYVFTGGTELVKYERLGSEAEGLELVGEAMPSVEAFAVNVRVRNGVAAVANYEDGLRLFDVSDPAAPVEVGHAAPTGGDPDEIWNDVKWLDSYVLVASSEVGLVVVDAADPASPVQVATWPPAGSWTSYNVHTVWVDEAARLAYLGFTGQEVDGEWLPGGLDIVDLADPTAPVAVASWSAEDVSLVHDLYVGGGYAYLCAWDAGLKIVDVSDPAQPVLAGTYDAYDRRTSHSVWVSEIGGRRIAVHGDEDYGAHLRVLDVTDPAAVQVLAEWETRPEVSIHNVMLLGSTAWIAHYQDGVRVLDLADPSAPVEVAHFETWDPDAPDVGLTAFEGAVGIDVQGDLVFVADSHRGLVVLRRE